jgi:hypothetical protein
MMFAMNKFYLSQVPIVIIELIQIQIHFNIILLCLPQLILWI